MRCFGNGKPNLSASQSTRNKGDSVIYTHMKNLYKEEKKLIVFFKDFLIKMLFIFI